MGQKHFTSLTSQKNVVGWRIPYFLESLLGTEFWGLGRKTCTRKQAAASGEYLPQARCSAECLKYAASFKPQTKLMRVVVLLCFRWGRSSCIMYLCPYCQHMWSQDLRPGSFTSKLIFSLQRRRCVCGPELNCSGSERARKVTLLFLNIQLSSFSLSHRKQLWASFLNK